MKGKTARGISRCHASELKTLDLPHDGTLVPFEITVELTAGHEVVLLPLKPD